MRYCSTRGGVSGYTFEQTVLSGFTSDGGMLMPERIPLVSADTMKQWSTLSYPEIVVRVASLFIEDEIPFSDLSNLVTKAFERFENRNVVQLSKLKPSLVVAELFHGPTAAFKDLALSCVGQVMNYVLQRKNKHAVAIVATSGDTGSAAIEAVRSMPAIDIIVLLPKGFITRVQELMMTTVTDSNIHTFRGEGNSDELDEVVRRCFEDEALVAKHGLCSMNSVNWARIVFQIAHYFWLYFQVCPEANGSIEVVVPTGGSGNIVAGIVASKMGLPVRLVASVNRNDAFGDVLRTGTLNVSQPVVPSLAPAMDIMVPYNFERVLFIFSDCNSQLVADFMNQVNKQLQAPVPLHIMEKIRTVLVSSYTADDDCIQQTIQRCWQDNGYHICPHTATAVAYHYSHPNEAQVPRVCLSTASPIKFEDVYQTAGIPPLITPKLQELKEKPEKYVDIYRGEDWVQIVKDTIRSCSRSQ